MRDDILKELLNYVEKIFNFNTYSIDDGLFVRVLSEALVRFAITMKFDKQRFLEAVSNDFDYFNDFLNNQQKPEIKEKPSKKKILN